tara:strand:- start:438 stop:584 length:147 start_codon:yes stop_codon:yes gene_type:complete
MIKYHITLESGRDAVITAEDDMDAAYAADETAKLMDDYLINLEPIHDA